MVMLKPKQSINIYNIKCWGWNLYYNSCANKHIFCKL